MIVAVTTEKKTMRSCVFLLFLEATDSLLNMSLEPKGQCYKKIMEQSQPIIKIFQCSH